MERSGAETLPETLPGYTKVPWLCTGGMVVVRDQATGTALSEGTRPNTREYNHSPTLSEFWVCIVR